MRLHPGMVGLLIGIFVGDDLTEALAALRFYFLAITTNKHRGILIV
jgi:hypothetical protein